MTLRLCRDCATAFAVVSSRCPRCKSTNYREGITMPKVSRHQGASYKDRPRAGGVAEPSPVVVETLEFAIEPEPEPELELELEPEPELELEPDLSVFTAIDVEVAAEVTKAKPSARRKR